MLEPNGWIEGTKNRAALKKINNTPKTKKASATKALAPFKYFFLKSVNANRANLKVNGQQLTGD
ncbi:MAG: hypothetical protein AB8F74_05125 [Saprospiraceae bacterium]